MRSAKATYSSGPDDIPSVFWVNLASSLATPISIIFTSSYQFATLPQEWREATVFPLFKKGDPSSVSNYRPISLTCTLCKVMESIIKDSLLSFAQANNIFSPCQHGFIPGKSTCTHLLESHFDWCSGLDKREFFDAVTIDFKKAFDVVPHHKLLLKLTSIGLCGQTIEWIKSFLANRKQRVRINKEFSSEAGVSSGVIQGSTLGPILFAFYINDLPEACHGCTVEMFADDVIVYKCIRDSTHRSCLQAALDSLLSWTTKWCLDLSTDKCYYFQIGYSNYVLLYHIGPDILHPCQSIVDLGVTVSSALKHSLNCSNIASKACSRAFLVFKTFLSRNPTILARACITYVRPLLEYCYRVWSPFLRQDVRLIENVQRSFTRRLFRRCRLPQCSYKDRLAYLNLPTLELRRIYSDLIFMFKLTHGLISTSLINALNYAKCDSTRGHSYKLFINRYNKPVLS